MHLKELVAVLEQIDASLKKNNLPGLYKKLITALNQAKKKPSPEITARIVQQRELIREAHQAAEPVRWGSSMQQIYEKLGAVELIGSRAMARIDQVFQIHEADPGSMAETIGELVEQTNELGDQVRTLRDGLRPLVQDDVNALPPKPVLQILFPDDVAAPTMRTLDEALQQWDAVLEAFHRLIREPVTDSAILNIAQRPVIIELMVDEEVIDAICRATCEVLGVYEKYLDIKRVGLEVNNLELRNRGIADQLQKEADLLIRNTASDVTKALMEAYEWKKEAERSDVHNHVARAVSTIFDFVKEEGKIDIRDDGRPEPGRVQLAEAFSVVDSLQARISQLVHAEHIDTDTMEALAIEGE